MASLNDWRDECWRLAEDNGFHEGRANSRDDTLVRLCLLHSEVSEAVQLVKRHGPEAGGLAEELADVFIRALDLCGCLKIDLDQAMRDKMAKNYARPRKYGTPREEKL